MVSSGVFPDLEPIEPLVEPEPIVAQEASVSSEIEPEAEPELSIPGTVVAPTPELSKQEEEEEEEEEEEKEAESSATPISATPGQALQPWAAPNCSSSQ